MRYLAATAVCLAFLLAAGGARGQNLPRNYISVQVVQVRSEGVPAFESFVKKVTAGAEKNAAGEAGSAKRRTMTYQLISGAPNQYAFVTEFESWADSEKIPTAGAILTKAYGEDEGAKYLQEGGAQVLSSITTVYRQITSQGMKTSQVRMPAAYLALTAYDLKPDMVPDWMKAHSQIKEAAESLPETPPVLSFMAVDGDTDIFADIIPYEKGADRDAWPSFQDVLSKALGEDNGVALQKRALSAVKGTKYYTLRLRPDLSYLPK
jgi:hypothetical protein